MDDEENYRVVVLKSGGHEYQDVMKKFNGSVGNPRQIQEVNVKTALNDWSFRCVH
jgi:hypothetical protein